MEAKPYDELSDAEIMALCCYREARGEPMYAKRAVCHVIANRVAKPGWWGTDVHTVILKPWQFSSFNVSDPNNTVWPLTDSQAWLDCATAASVVLDGTDHDPTDGATHYHDTSIGFPKAWGKEEDYENTLNFGRLRFYKLVV